jgi:hypothetical protein
MGTREEILRLVAPIDSVLPGLVLNLRDEAFAVQIADAPLGYQGYFDDVRREILLSSDADNLKRTLLHELGHLIDAHGLPEDDLRNLYEVIEATDAIQYLFQMSERGMGSVRDAQGVSRFERVDDEEVRYLLFKDELVARAFVQYIAEASGDQELLEVVRADTRPVTDEIFYARQWLSSDFKPVYATFDSIATRLGWRELPS